MKITDTLIKIWVEDTTTITWLFGQWWAYSIVPILVYAFFLTIKWALLTLPVWLPISAVLRGFSFKFPLKFSWKK